MEKLIRDNIPDIAKSKGEELSTRLATNQEYQSFLYKKLQEEVSEFLESKSKEELADIMEVIEAIQNHNNWNDIQEIKEQKAKEKGKFEKKLILSK